MVVRFADDGRGAALRCVLGAQLRKKLSGYEMRPFHAKFSAREGISWDRLRDIGSSPQWIAPGKFYGQVLFGWS